MCESCKKYRAKLEEIKNNTCDFKLVKHIEKFLRSIPEPVEEERTCGNCFVEYVDIGNKACAECDDGNSNWKPCTERKEP